MGDDEGHHHRFRHLLLQSVSGGPLSVFLVLFFECFLHVISRCDLDINDDLPPLTASIPSEPYEVRFQPCACNLSFVRPLIGPRVLGPDGDLVSRCHHRFPIFPLLLVGDQSSLDEDVVQEDVKDYVVQGDDFCTDLRKRSICKTHWIEAAKTRGEVTVCGSQTSFLAR